MVACDGGIVTVEVMVSGMEKVTGNIMASEMYVVSGSGTTLTTRRRKFCCVVDIYFFSYCYQQEDFCDRERGISE